MSDAIGPPFISEETVRRAVDQARLEMVEALHDVLFGETFPDAHIKVEQDDRGWYVVTVYARENDQTGRPLDYLKRDTRVIPA